MKLNTLHFGEIEIGEEQTIEFTNGLPGFEEYTRFVVLPLDGGVLFVCLQSLDDGNLSFIGASPFDFFPDYEFELSEAAKEELGIETEADVSVYGLITVASSGQEATMNLLAPIVVNAALKRAKQIVLHDSPYKTRHPLATDQEASDGKAGEPSC